MKNQKYVKKIEKALFDKFCDASLKCKSSITIVMNTGDMLTISSWKDGYTMRNSVNPLVNVVEDASLEAIAMLIADGNVR